MYNRQGLTHHLCVTDGAGHEQQACFTCHGAGEHREEDEDVGHDLDRLGGHDEAVVGRLVETLALTGHRAEHVPGGVTVGSQRSKVKQCSLKAEL